MNTQEAREARIKDRKQRERRELTTNIVVGTLVVIGVGLFIALCAWLGALLTMVAWNYGVVAIVAATGGSVGKIGIVTAFCANIAISVLGRIFRPTTPVQTKS